MKIAFKILTLTLSIVGSSVSCTDNTGARIKSLKASGNLYPKGQIKSIKAVNFIDTQYVWVNTSYRDYKSKDLFSELINFEFALKDQQLAEIVKSDTFALCDIVSEKLRDKAIVHFIGQTLLNDRLNIYFDTNNESEAFGVVHDLKMPVRTTFSEDVLWTRFQQLMDKK